MKAYGIEGVAYFMSHSCGQQCQGIQTFCLNVFRVFFMSGRFIPYQDQVALVFAADGGNEDVQESVLRVKDFRVPRDGGLALLDRVP